MRRVRFILLSVLLFALSFLLISCGQKPKEQPFDTLPAEEQVAQVKEYVRTAKLTLTKADKYRCCIDGACTFCLLHSKDSSCPCADMLKATPMQPVCAECKWGWTQGKGVVEGVNPKDVRTTF